MRPFRFPMCSFLLLPALLPAQAPAPDSTTLSPVVITATRAPTLAASTAATTVVTGEELRRRGVVRLADAIRLAPGVAVSSAGGEGAQSSLFLRGGNSNFAKIVVDGVPVNAPGGAIDLSTLTTDNIERIEIVRGAGGALHGSDAMTGVIQIFTRRTGGSLAEVRHGSRDRLRDLRLEHAGVHAMTGGARLEYSLGGGDHRGDGALAFNNQFRNTTLRARAGVEGSRSAVALASGYTTSRYHYPTDGSGAVVDSNALTGLDRANVALSARHALTPRASLHLTAGTARDHAISRDDPDSPGDPGFHSRSTATGARSLATAHGAIVLPMSVSLAAGGAMERQSIRSRGRDSFTPEPYTFDEARASQALFAQLAGGPRRLSIDVSGRRESYRKHGPVNTGRAAIAAELRPGTMIRASIGRAFKEPALDQLYNTSFAVGNPSLKPERSRVLDIGGETRLGPGVIGATIFRQRFTDLVQYRFDGGNPAAPNYYNVAAARADGIELEGRLDPWLGVAARGSYTFLETEVTRAGTSAALESGKPLLRRPRRQGSVAIDGRTGPAALHAQLERIGGRDDFRFVGFSAERVRLAPYTLLTAAIELPLGSTEGAFHPALTVRGENLGDARYENAAGFAMPGRTVYLGVRARW